MSIVKPWDRWEDGERVGLEVASQCWKMWLFPYRTCEWRDVDDFGPWKWNAPGFIYAIRGRVSR